MSEITNPSENVETKTVALEVEVIIPEEILKENESLEYLYDRKKKVLTYELASETTKDFQEKLKELLVNSSSEDIVVFNPIVEALGYIQSFKELKYYPELKNEKEYTDAMSKLGKFNTATTTAGKTLKDPKTAYNKMVIAVEKLMKAESDNVKAALAVNFKPYLDEKAKKEAEKIAKRDAEKDSMIADLSADNAENLEKLKNQKIATRKLEIESATNKIVAEVSEKLPTLNADGLAKLREEVLEYKLEEPDTDEVTFENVDKTVFRQSHARAVLTATSLIDAAIKSLNDAAEKEVIKTENIILKANTPAGAFTIDDDDHPFEIPTAPEPVKDLFAKRKSLSTDEGKLEWIVTDLTNLNNLILDIMSNFEDIKFEDPSLEKMKEKLQNVSVKNISDWTEKTLTWTKGKQELYINFLNSQKNEN